MKKKLAVIAVLVFSFTALATAQTATITDADSNLTDTQITAEFTGLPTDTQLEVQSLGDDTSTLETFTTSSTGTATVTWRHNPFEDGTALISDGWTYAVRSSDGSTNFEFEVAHGNMLLGLDTFYDGSLNGELWSFETIQSSSSDCSNTAQEEVGSILVSSNDAGEFDVSCESRLTYDGSVYESETAKLNLTGVSGSYSYIEIYQSDSQVQQFNFDSSGVLELYYDSADSEVVAEISDNTYTYLTSNSKFSFGLSAETPDGFDGGSGNIRVNDFSKVPKISQNAFPEATLFNPATNNMQFSNFLINDNGTSGIEFSNESLSWSVTPPSTGGEMNFRNTGSGTLGAVAVDTSELLGGLQFNPLQPNNNTAFVVEENSSLSQEFIYEFLYQRSDCNESAALTVGWTLYNETSGNQLSSSVYPSPFMAEGQCTFYRQFTEEETLPAGDYRWTAQFTEGNIGVTRFYDMYFSIEEADQVPVSFELRDPQDGADVELSNGTYQFDYSVDAQNSGTLNLVIPQYDDNVRYSTSIPAGNTTQSVELQLDADATYDWYLTYTNSTTYQSGTNTFTALAETDGGGGGDGGDGGGEQGNLLVNAVYSFLELFGLTGEAADIFIGSVMLTLITIGVYIATTSELVAFLSFNVVGTALSVAQLLPNWFIFLQISLGGAAFAYLYQKVSSD